MNIVISSEFSEYRKLLVTLVKNIVMLLMIN